MAQSLVIYHVTQKYLSIEKAIYECVLEFDFDALKYFILIKELIFFLNTVQVTGKDKYSLNQDFNS